MTVRFKRFFLILVVVLAAGTIRVFGWPWSTDMWKQPSIKPYRMPLRYPEFSVATDGTRLEPLPREEFEKITQNPKRPTAASLENGQRLFNTFCAACHGMDGKGNGPVIERGFYPMDLTSVGVKGRTDGYIYAYIRYGGKVMMPSYRENVSSEEAWDIVNYVRKLQGKLNNTVEENQ